MDQRLYLFFILTLVKFLLTSVLCSSVAHYWSYNDISKWTTNFPQCNGTEQSPINIINNKAVAVSNVDVLRFKNYDRPLHIELVNNGKTVKLGSMFINNLTVPGLGMYLQNNFTLQQVHFHWGDTDDSGSEHRIDGIGSAMEVHFVHFNLEKYSDIEHAQQRADGVLVLSVLVEVSKNASVKSVWQNITYQLASIVKPNANFKPTINDFSLQQLLPENRRDFYFYRGSFTTPSCFQSVTWVVFKEKLLILQEYVQIFRDLRTTIDGHNVTRFSSNIRPVQRLYSREVLKTFDASTSHKYLRTEEKIVGGHGVIVVVRLHMCQLPPLLSLSVIIPSLDINWKGVNFTSDLKHTMLDPRYSYGVTLEMHDHPLGFQGNTRHVMVKLTDSPHNKPVDVFDHHFKKRVIDTCSWLKPAVNLACSRVSSGELLEFTLSLQDVCLDTYRLVVKKNTDIFLNTLITKNKRVHLVLKNTENISVGSLNDSYFVLAIDKASDVNNVKLYVEIEHDIPKVLVMEGDYGPVRECENSSGGTPHHVKLIVGVAVGVFIVTMVLLTVCLLWRRFRHKPAGNLLVPQMEQDTAV